MCLKQLIFYQELSTLILNEIAVSAPASVGLPAKLYVRLRHMPIGKPIRHEEK